MTKDIYTYTRESDQVNEKIYYEIREKNPEAVKRADDLLKVLGLSGLWRGYYQACIEILKHDNIIKTD